MEPTIVVALLWSVFAVAHIGLASRPVRGRLVALAGERGFMLVFSLVAAGLFTLLVGYYAGHRGEGVAGLALGAPPGRRWLLVGAVVAGTVFMSASLASYLSSPYALKQETSPSPRGIERVTRHPFFVGLALWGLAHALLAPHLVGAVFMAGFALVAMGGSWHQDAKLLALRGKPHADYLAATSWVPFGAIVAGRQRLVWREMPFGAFAVGIGVAVALRAVHGEIFARQGAWFIGGVVAGAAVIGVLTELRAARAGRAVAQAPTPARTIR